MFEIQAAEEVEEELAQLRAYDRKQILDKIAEQLAHEPAKETRNKKLIELKPPWTGDKPFWELRVGEYRVFYDVDADRQRVLVRVVRHKPAHKTTKEIL